GGDAGVGPHSQADDGDLGDLGVVEDRLGADGLGGGLGGGERVGQVGLGDGGADLGLVAHDDVLDDPVDDVVGLGDRADGRVNGARAVGHFLDGDPGLVLRQGRAADGPAEASGVGLGDDPGPFGVGEAAADV